MSEITLKKLSEVIGASLPETVDGSVIVKRVLTQSVYVNSTDVVISAGWYTKDKTVAESLERGAIAVFCDQETKEKFPDARVIAVEDPLRCVYLFETWRAKDCHAKRIVITGSVGKTTTTGLINSVIAASFHTLTHHTMSNSHGAILRNVQKLEPDHEYWVQEVGGVQPDYIESSAVFLCPDVVVLTNIGESHLNLYKTKENILKDKGSLERYAKPDGVVIINGDDEILNNAPFTHRVIRFSLKDPTADYYACDISTELDGIHFTVKCDVGSVRVHLNLFGDYNAYNALAAVACGRLAGLDLDRIASLMEAYHPSGMRQNLVRVGGYTFFVDSFNAEPKTVLGSAQTLTQMPVPEGGRKIFVSGHIDKIGEASAKLHAQLGRDLARLKLDQVVLFAGDSVHTYQAMKEAGFENVIHFDKRSELDAWLEKNITRKDVVFFKSGQFEAALAKTVDHVFGTCFQNEQQFNEGKVVEHNGFKYRLRQDYIAELEGYKGTETHLVIPAKYEKYTITRIAPRAFTRSYQLESIEFPDTVQVIGREAFYVCPKLKTLKLPKRLKYIGDNAFNYCKGLENVEIPYGTIHMGRRAFYDCMALKSISIPETVGFLGENVLDVEKPIEGRNLVVACQCNSYAEAFLKNQGFRTEVMPLSFFKKIEPKANPTTQEKRLLERAGYWVKAFNKRTGNRNILSNAQKAQVEEFWGHYTDLFIPDTIFHSFYTEKTGVFDLRYMPIDLYYCYIDPYFNNWSAAKYMDNKCMYPQLFKTIAQPDVVLYRVNNIWTDTNYQLVDEKEMERIVEESDELVMKQANDSEGGSNIFFINGETKIEQFRDACDKIKKDIVVQKSIQQHPVMSSINPSSVNTIRIMTLLGQNDVKICSSIVRMGHSDSRTDNVSKGGLACGVDENGRLKNVAYNFKGESFHVHPNSGIQFNSIQIPSYEAACDLVREAHPYIPHFRLVSWDLAIEESGRPVLVEANLSYGALNSHQLNNGALFGEDTEKILEEVFRK